MRIRLNNLKHLIKSGEYLESYGISGKNRDKVQGKIYNLWKSEVIKFAQSLDNERRYYDLKKNVKDLNRYNRFGEVLSVIGAMRDLYNMLILSKFDKVGKFNYHSQNIFIIHGHNTELICKVEEIINGLDFNSLVLAEQEDSRAAIINGLDEHLDKCKGCCGFIYL